MRANDMQSAGIMLVIQYDTKGIIVRAVLCSAIEFNTFSAFDCFTPERERVREA